MNKHTPGPWRHEGSEVWATRAMRINNISAGTPMIATVCKHEDAEQFDYDANARLIAAAPELLEALQLMIDKYEFGGWPASTITVARAAIAKATEGAA